MSGLCHLLHSLRGANRPLCRGLAGKATCQPAVPAAHPLTIPPSSHASPTPWSPSICLVCSVACVLAMAGPPAPNKRLLVLSHLPLGLGFFRGSVLSKRRGEAGKSGPAALGGPSVGPLTSASRFASLPCSRLPVVCCLSFGPFLGERQVQR